MKELQKKWDIMMAKKKTKVHKKINGQLLQMDKKFSQLKQKQKEKINEWLYQEYRSLYIKNSLPPDSRYNTDILDAVQERITDAGIWLPFGELQKYFYSRKNSYRKRYEKELKRLWEAEEAQAHIRGWDFSHIEGRYKEYPLPWSYRDIVCSYIKDDSMLLDIDTGGGEFLRSLNHPYDKTSATEGYPPNVELCKRVLLPLGIDFKEAADHTALPYDGNTFDIIINRHGSYDISELYRLLKPGGIFITQQVGDDNERDLVKLLLPDAPKQFHGLNLTEQKEKFIDAGFSILYADEAFPEIEFYDVGALVWFAKIIEWEFVDFSVERCFEALLNAQRILAKECSIKGTTHRYIIAAKKPEEQLW